MKEKKIILENKSWFELNRKLEKLTKSNKTKVAGDIFEIVVKYFLETAPQYKTKLKKVYLLKEVPNFLKKKLNLPYEDEGIDLIAETYEKTYWAIQCKYRSNPNETLTLRGDLSTFNNLAFTYCKNISHGIVCATVNKPPKKIKLLKSVGFETLETWLSLDDNDQEIWKSIQRKINKKIEKPKKLSPRPHQVKAINKTLSHFKSFDRGKLIMPCGTGKSLTAFWIAKQMKAKTILIAVPSLALLQQTLKVWTREYLIHGIQPEWLCVCSDDTVKEEQDDFVSYSYDLGIKVTTNPKEIKSFLKKKSKLKIIFTTYQSGRMTAQGSKGIKFDLGIMDEAHKTVGSGSKPMAHLIHEKNIKIKHRLFMTATERLFRGDKDEYLSMDDPRDYGKLIYELTFKDAINAKPPIISDYKIVTFGITTPEIEEVYKSNKFLEVKKELKDITAREFATALALRKAIKKYNIKNAISFHRSIRRADNFREQQQLISKIYPEYGKLKSYHVAGDMPTSQRANQMRSFAENKGLMTNARCLTEGVDLPAIDCVCFTDPKRSKVDIVQAAGRALRLAKGKKFGYILIPIFVPDNADFIESSEEQGYDEVSITVRALATSDKRIVEYLRAISEGRKPRGGSPVDGKISINELHKIEADEFDKAIKLKVWEKVAVANYKPYDEAKKWVHLQKFKTQIDFLEKKGLKIFKEKKWPLDIPRAPSTVYRQEFRSWGDWLGTNSIWEGYKRDLYLTYKKAKMKIQNNKIQNNIDYLKWHKKNKPSDLPANPAGFYKNFGWTNWGDFLGTGRQHHKKYKEYKLARKFVHTLNLKKQLDWYNYINKHNLPNDIPKYPQSSYQNIGWVDWGDWLGHHNVFKGTYLTYEKAKKLVRKLNFKNKSEWYKFAKTKKPKNIPYNPDRDLKDWKSWQDFLGYEYTAPNQRKFVSYEEAKKYAQEKKIKNLSQWHKLHTNKKIPLKYPYSLVSVYKNKFEGAGVFFNSGNAGPFAKNYLKFNQLKKIVTKLNFKNRKEYFIYIKKNKKQLLYPATPDRVYKDIGWNGWSDFLGNIPKIRDYKNIKLARQYAKKNKINSSYQWFKHVSKMKNKFPIDIPKKPFISYKKEWKGWDDFFGKS